MDSPRRKRPGETVFGLLLLGFSLFVLWRAYLISGFDALSSPGAFPMTAAAVMTVAALVTVLRNARLPPPDLAGRGRAAAFYRQITPRVVLVFVAIALAFATLLDTLGFLIAALAFLVAGVWFLHRRGVVGTLVISLAALAAIYLVFRLVFKVVLPEGIVPEREIMAWIEALFASGPADR